MNFKLAIAGKSKVFFVFIEYINFVSILGIYLKKWEKFKLHIDEPPYCISSTPCVNYPLQETVRPLLSPPSFHPVPCLRLSPSPVLAQRRRRGTPPSWPGQAWLLLTTPLSGSGRRGPPLSRFWPKVPGLEKNQLQPSLPGQPSWSHLALCSWEDHGRQRANDHHPLVVSGRKCQGHRGPKREVALY